MCFNELRCGEAALQKFSAIMGIPGFAHYTYRRLRRRVCDANAKVTNNVPTAAVATVHRAYGAGDGMPDSNSEGEEEFVPDLGIEGDDDSCFWWWW